MQFFNGQCNVTTKPANVRWEMHEMLKTDGNGKKLFIIMVQLITKLAEPSINIICNMDKAWEKKSHLHRI
jgi:hypothetical protein